MSRKKTHLTQEHETLVQRQWQRWYAGVEELWGLEEGQPDPDIADMALDHRRLEDITDPMSPWQDLPLGHYPAAIDRLLEQAQKDFGKTGAMIVGARLWKGLASPKLKFHLAKHQLYGRCVSVLDSHMNISSDPQPHQAWLARLGDNENKTLFSWISEFRTGGMVWKRAPALFPFLYPADTGPGFRGTGRQSLSELSVMVEYNMDNATLNSSKEGPGQVRTELCRGKKGIADYLEGYLHSHTLDLSQASQALNILGWIGRQQVRQPTFSEDNRHTMLRAADFLGDTDEQRALAISGLRRERLIEMAQPAAERHQAIRRQKL